ncbi:uncharacterized protein DS421_10g295340 [Arachis hypogaea]|nr:uncharacterized protein DS421_10g295340 [Arachis hypogaea]
MKERKEKGRRETGDQRRGRRRGGCYCHRRRRCELREKRVLGEERESSRTREIDPRFAAVLPSFSPPANCRREAVPFISAHSRFCYHHPILSLEISKPPLVAPSLSPPLPPCIPTAPPSPPLESRRERREGGEQSRIQLHPHHCGRDRRRQTWWVAERQSSRLRLERRCGFVAAGEEEDASWRSGRRCAMGQSEPRRTVGVLTVAGKGFRPPQVPRLEEEATPCVLTARRWFYDFRDHR